MQTHTHWALFSRTCVSWPAAQVYKAVGSSCWWAAAAPPSAGDSSSPAPSGTPSGLDQSGSCSCARHLHTCVVRRAIKHLHLKYILSTVESSLKKKKKVTQMENSPLCCKSSANLLVKSLKQSRSLLWCLYSLGSLGISDRNTWATSSGPWRNRSHNQTS